MQVKERLSMAGGDNARAARGDGRRRTGREREEPRMTAITRGPVPGLAMAAE